MNRQKIKEFWKKNGAKIVAGTAAVAGFVIAYKLGSRNAVNKIGTSATLDHADEFVKSCRFVDEDIFTDLALQIEDLVIADGIDEGVIERTYTMAYPRFGGTENGFYKVLKNVQVLVRDAGEVK